MIHNQNIQFWLINGLLFFIACLLLKRLIFSKKNAQTKQKTQKGCGIKYEHAVAKYLKRHGYWDVQVTKASGDFGADILARKGLFKKYVIQCKFYQNPVGVSAVQEVVASKAVYRCNSAMVVTNSTFTAAAKKLAHDNRVILLDEIR